MSTHIFPSITTSTDRLGMTLLIAVIVHAIVILGVSFKPELVHSTEDKHPPIEIVLVHQRSEKAPEKAELLAQANLEGGGNTDDKVRPTSPASTPIPPDRPGHSTEITMAASPPQQPQPPQDKILTQEQAQQQQPQQEFTPSLKKQPLTAAELIELSMEMANLSAEIDRDMQAYAQRTKHRYISSQAREYRDAAYAKIERIGNLNYPEEAKRKSVSGSLILDVAINANGTISNITVVRPSGEKILDDAAIRIVRLAAPFAPFPDELRKDTDILHITRTWQFLNNNRLDTGR